MLILISDAFDATLPQRLAKFGEVTEDKERLKDADVVLVRSKTKCTKEYLEKAAKLKLIIRGGVGVDNIDVAAAKARGIMVHNTPKASSIAVAELAFSLMIAIPNHLIRGHESMKRGEWIKNQLERTELYGKTLCLVGMGNIAKQVAIRAKAFGMRVVSYDKYVIESEYAQMKPTLQEAIKDADYISLHTPLTPETENMINKDIISLMKKGVVIINTGRGNCVHAQDMVQALHEGYVHTYATDVWPSDPPEKDYPLLKEDHVIMLPHIGASTVENLGRISDEVVNIIEEKISGGLL